MLHDHLTTQAPCPCGTGKPYSRCCEPAIEGSEPAITAEALMRSRYTAFVLQQCDYLVETIHPSHREAIDPNNLKQQTAQTHWLGLRILETEGGKEKDKEGMVAFIADYWEKGHQEALEERSRFVREEGRWYYLDGTTNIIPATRKLGRNDPCPCGSGKKFKRCCLDG
jgi:SEC-C motif-containing protein